MSLIQYKILDKSEKVAVISLKRPEKKNAIDENMIFELHQALDNAENNEKISIVIIEGNQDAFSVGADLVQISNLKDDKEFKAFLENLQSLFMRIKTSKKTFIASLEGYVLGGGFELALHCDYRIASEETVLGMPEVKVGLLPAAGGIYELVRLIGSSKTLEVICLGELMDANQAYKLNIINQVVPQHKLNAAKMEVVKKLERASPAVLQIAKELANNTINSEEEISEKRKEASIISTLFQTKEVQDGFLRFLET